MGKVKNIFYANKYLLYSLLIVCSICICLCGGLIQYLLYGTLLIIFLMICLFLDISDALSVLLALITYQKCAIKIGGYELLLVNSLIMLFTFVYSFKLISKLFRDKKIDYGRELGIIGFLLLMIIIRSGEINLDLLLIVFKIILLFLISNKIDKREKILDAFLYGIVLHFMATLFVLFWNLSSFNDMIMFDDRFAGFTGNPNTLQMTCLIAIFVILYLWQQKTINITLFINASIIFILIGILTYSKTFFIGLMIWFVLIFSIIVYQNIKHRHLIISCALLIIIFCFLFFNDYVVHMIERFSNYNSENGVLDKMTTGRWWLWKECFEEWIKSPINILFGCGINNDIFSIYRHSTIVLLVTKYGLIGCAFLICYFIMIYKRASGGKFKILQNCLWIGVLIVSSVESVVFMSTSYILMLLLITAKEKSQLRGDYNYDTKSYSLYLAGRKRTAKYRKKMY